jgi:mRNA-degrading endonuclease RelE of RelBE toxin-antitoxin system
MSITVIPTVGFVKDLKRISKKYKGILLDIANLSAQLKENPTMGTDLGQNIYKIRLAISGTNKGKSGGARIITYVVLINEVVYLSEIYLKSEHDTVDANTVIQRLKKDGII